MAGIFSGVSRKMTYTTSNMKLNNDLKNNIREIENIATDIGRHYISNHLNDSNAEFVESIGRVKELQEENERISEEIEKLKQQHEEEVLLEQEEKKQRQFELEQKRQQEAMLRQQQQEEQEDLLRKQQRQQQQLYQQQMMSNTPPVQPAQPNTESKICPNCGKPNKLEAKFCMFCGNTIA